MFGKLYFGEVKKLLRPKTLIILAIILVVIFSIFAISYNSLLNMFASAEDDISISDILGFQYGKQAYTEAQIASLIENTKQAIVDAEKEQEGSSFFYRMNSDTAYEQKGYLKALEYVRDNALYGEEIEIYSSSSAFSSKTAEGFMSSFFSLLLSISLIYGIVIGAGSYAAEMKNGTLKMLMMRPITRNKLTTAKILALLTMVTGIIIAGVLLSYMFGLIRYGAEGSLKVLYVFNGMSCFMSGKGLGLFFTIMFGLISAYAMTLFAFALGTLFRNRIGAIIIGIIINSGFIATILTLLKMGRFLFTTSANLGIYFGVTSVIPAGGNFFIALPVFLAYLALFIGSTYFLINKRDLA